MGLGELGMVKAGRGQGSGGEQRRCEYGRMRSEVRAGLWEGREPEGGGQGEGKAKQTPCHKIRK